MFLDLLDTTRTSKEQNTIEECTINAIQGESMLFYLLMSGQTPTLNQTQIMDSAIIHQILLNNHIREPFLKLIKTGKIQLTLYTGNGAQSLQDYFKNSLKFGLDNEQQFFDFSIFPFLKQYDANTRRTLHATILKTLEHNTYNFKTSGVEAAHIEYIGAIIENIQDIDRAIKGQYVLTKTFNKHLDPLFQSQCQALMNFENTDPEFIRLCRELLSKGPYGNRRSAYYNVLKSMQGHYSKIHLSKLKQTVDNCYNQAIASSIPDDGYSLNFSSEFVDLAQSIQNNGGLQRKELIAIKPSDKSIYITWHTLVDMLEEVDRLEQSKGISRVAALNEYKRTQSFKPIIQVAKYLAHDTAASLIPGVPQVVEIVSDLITGAASDWTGGLLKKQSVGEIGVSIKEGKRKSKILGQTIEFLSMTMRQS
ncbi:hypothetical protein AB4Z21_07715 [Paenibacillus sp. MCAF20]